MSLSFKRIAGVNVDVSPDGTIRVDCCLINVEKKSLLITKKIIGLNTITALKAHLDARMPVALNLTGKGILYKALHEPGALNSESFGAVLPGADVRDFYVQSFVSGEKQFVALLRKHEADRLLKELNQLGCQVFALSLGPFPVTNVWPQLNVYGTELIFDGHSITFNEAKHWLSYQYHQENRSAFPLKIESETIAEALLIPYAAAFQLALHDKVDMIKADVPSLQQAFAASVNGQALKKTGVVLLSVFFVLLLGNFVLLTHFTGENEKLSRRASLADNDIRNYEALAASVAADEARLTAYGWDDGTCKSCLISQLAAVLPATVTLTAVEVNPVDSKNSRDTGTPVFHNKTIMVNGTTTRIVDLNEWMAAIKIKKLVRQVELINYGFNKEQQTGAFAVTISY